MSSTSLHAFDYFPATPAEWAELDRNIQALLDNPEDVGLQWAVITNGWRRGIRLSFVGTEEQAVRVKLTLP
jgi:hypothetical protein